MATHPGKLPTTARVTFLQARERATQQNPHGKAPHRAQLAHLWSASGDDSAWDGAGQMIALDEVGYETGSARLRSMPLSPASARRWYPCTRHADGHILCGEPTHLEAAVSVLTTFLDTARGMGYQIHPQHTQVNAGTRYLARQGAAWVMFWIGESDAPATTPSPPGLPVTEGPQHPAR